MARKLRNRETITLEEENSELLAKICKICGNGFQAGDMVIVRKGLMRSGPWINLRHVECVVDSDCGIDDVFLPENF